MQGVLLAGNGSFRNHGCEAIARGTLEVLTRAFGPSLRVWYAAHSRRSECLGDTGLLGEKGAALESLPFCGQVPKHSRAWFEYQTNRFAHTALGGCFNHLRNVILQADAVVCLGGDNYSLDYGYPERFIQFDRFAQKLGKPVVYWGASVGPFSADPAYEQRLRSHLSSISAILARETATVTYLRTLGVTDNVHLVADPAFAMPATRPDPSRFVLDRKDFMGVNFSTTVARLMLNTRHGAADIDYASKYGFLEDGGTDDGTYKSLCRAYANIAASLNDLCEGGLVFIPHVTSGAHCDHRFMTDIADCMESMGIERPLIVPDDLSAPEYKWIISQARLFIGARTHSTIAAFSSGVPTVALAYSLKARGLVQDMYGSDDYCIPGDDVGSERILAAAKRLLAHEEMYRSKLALQASMAAERAFAAGEILASIVHS